MYVDTDAFDGHQLLELNSDYRPAPNFEACRYSIFTANLRTRRPTHEHMDAATRTRSRFATRMRRI